MELFNVSCARDTANFIVLLCDTLISRAHGVVVSHPLRMRKALGSNPIVSMFIITLAAVFVQFKLLLSVPSAKPFKAPYGDRTRDNTLTKRLPDQLR